ncbi:hypothetical protein HMPREF9979_03377, partial [Staphylococcus epidermidis NIHLM018]
YLSYQFTGKVFLESPTSLIIDQEAVFKRLDVP